MTMNRLFFTWLSWATVASPVVIPTATGGTINNNNEIDLAMNSTNTTTISAKLVPVPQAIEIELWFPSARRQLYKPIETSFSAISAY
jgi:hypothetical protein